MRRIVVISSGLAGAKAATRIKRLSPEVEVNLVVPGGEETAGDGPFSRMGESRRVSEALTEARQVGVIKASEVQFDFEQNQVNVRSQRGLLQIRFNEVVLEVEASARLPRNLRAAGNVVPWPLEDSAVLDSWIQETKPGRAVIVGGGIALELIAPLLESGLAVTWVRTEDGSYDPDMWDVIERRIIEAGNGRVDVEDWTDVRVESLVPVLGEDGSVQSLQDGRGGEVAGDAFFWTIPQRALHPIIAQPGVELDASGLIAVDEHFRSGPEGLHIIGSGVSLPRLPRKTNGSSVPSVAMGEAAILASARVVANHLAGFVGDTAVWQGASGVFRASAPGVTVCKLGLTSEEATANGFDSEFALLRTSASLFSNAEPVTVKLICDKHSHVLLGAQIVASESCGQADTIANTVNVAIASSMTVERLSVLDFAGGGGELLQRAASILSNKLMYRFYGISAEELVASKEAGANFFMLDLRDNMAWKDGHIPDAYNIPYTQLKKRLQDEVPRFTPIVLISRTSDVAYSAACQLYGLGAKDLYVLDGGMEMWPYEVMKG
ncbi:FAD-dependent oxidoreductase [Desulfovibrio mangrovi]|uniref:FAD-dependent oxidoreductase n=1 Tax=Desulfovibrio mangrovi TaxID=2976983 RepID=UPI002248594F|nr:FAD-dependent oxidoreductase [Desulfovibrio mangrovi]UZP68148.1 FAD-dependent oxidoreductase [Desulfovibrio mangrovi]